MADKTFMAQVTHSVVEVYEITAGSATDATMKLGASIAGVDVPEVRLVKTTKTVRKATQPRTTVDDPVADAPVNDTPEED